jgi:hypothetical protein
MGGNQVKMLERKTNTAMGRCSTAKSQAEDTEILEPLQMQYVTDP